MTPPYLNYLELIEEAMLSVVQKLLKIVASQGMPRMNQFVIEFITSYPGVIISKKLLSEYPDRISIVIQYEFENLIVSDTDFSISLSFNNKMERMTIPFKAITAFQDPDADLFLDFAPDYDTEQSNDLQGIEKNNIISFSDLKK
jgi:hypothetical protein